MRRAALVALGALACCAAPVSAAPTEYKASGADAAAIQPTVDSFAAALGSHRQITWDDVTDDLADPNRLPLDRYFGQGIAFIQPGFKAFRVSSSSDPVFGSQYVGHFKPYSGQRIFAREDLNDFEVNFFVPGTRTPAAVNGFGTVFTDVDKDGPARIDYYGSDWTRLASVSAPKANDGLSFAGMKFDSAQVAVVVVHMGEDAFMVHGRPAETMSDLVALDDFVYSEPQAAPSYLHFATAAAEATEGGAVTVAPGWGGNLTVSYTTHVQPIGGTATPGADYSVNTAPGYHPWGDFIGGIDVRTSSDSVREGDETAVLQLVSDDFATIDEPSTVTVTIHDATPPGRDTTPPRLGAIHRSGRTLTFTSNEAGRVRATLERVTTVARTTRLRYRRLRGSLSKALRAGRNRLTIPRRLAGRRIGRGRYRVTLVARDAAGNRSKARRVTFRLPR